MGKTFARGANAPLNAALVCVDVCVRVCVCVCVSVCMCVCVCVCVEGGYRAVPYSFKFLGHSIQRTLWTNIFSALYLGTAVNVIIFRRLNLNTCKHVTKRSCSTVAAQYNRYSPMCGFHKSSSCSHSF